MLTNMRATVALTIASFQAPVLAMAAAVFGPCTRHQRRYTIVLSKQCNSRIPAYTQKAYQLQNARRDILVSVLSVLAISISENFTRYRDSEMIDGKY